jgi:hypothetical protein
MAHDPVPRSRRPKFGVISIAVGILGLATALIEPTAALVFGLMGTFFGLLSRRDALSRGVTGLVVNAAVLLLVVGIAANLLP